MVWRLVFENVEWKELSRVLVVLAGSRFMDGRMGVDRFGEGADGMLWRMGVAGLVGTGTLL